MIESLEIQPVILLIFMMAETNLNFISYNSQGFSIEKQKFCNDLQYICGNSQMILCNQENFLLKNNHYIIENCLPDYHIFFKPAVKHYQYGRASNGTFIAVPKILNIEIKDISPTNFRIQSLLLTFDDKIFLILNCYFPCDNRRIHSDNEVLYEMFCSIRNIIDSYEFDYFLCLGDMNTDFSRNTSHVTLMRSFLDEHCLLKAWDHFPVDFTFSFNIQSYSSYSTVDHFFYNSSLSNCVTDVGVYHAVDNTSFHSPIFCNLKFSHISPKTTSYSINDKSSLSWKKATNENKSNYCNKLSSLLNQINVPDYVYHCVDVHCNNPSHIHVIDEYINSVINSIDSASFDTIPLQHPVKTNSGAKNLPMWNEMVAPFKIDAQFWHGIWLSAGRPINTELHTIMKRTRNIYHMNIRKCKRAFNKIKADNFLNACVNGDIDLFKEIKRNRQSSNSNIPSNIDGIKTNISNHFADMYKTLYSSVNDYDDMSNVYDNINLNIDSNSMHYVNLINSSVVKTCVKKLKSGRKDAVLDMTSDCLINAPDILFNHLAVIFKFFLIHSHISLFMLFSTLIPLIKSKLNDRCSSSNYRSIAISSLLLKVFDNLIIHLFSSYLKFDELQFGFQANNSSNMCSWLAIETINYFYYRNSDVYTCVMDMKKAFDRVKHSTLFVKLSNSGLPLIYVRLLMIIYLSQFVNVKWNNELSYYFIMSNGVKQGAVLSPILYCFYTNDLFEALRNNRYGCWVNGNYCGIIAFADDILLIAPTITALQNMVSTVNNFAIAHNLEISVDVNVNKSKTKCIAFNRVNDELNDIYLNGFKLPWVTSAVHLGTNIENILNGLKKDILCKRGEFINKCNQLDQEFNYLHPDVRFKLNRIYNFSFYSSVLWDLFSSDFSRIESSYNTSVKFMYNLSYKTHRYLIEPITQYPHVKKFLIKRFLNFIDKLNNGKSIVSDMLDIVKLNVNSITGSNLRNISLLTGVYDYSELNKLNVNDINYLEINENELWRIGVINDIIDTRFNVVSIDNFTFDELNDILEFVCCH